MIRVLVWARSAIARAGLAALVGADNRFRVVGDSAADLDLVRAVRDHSPDVVLIDGTLSTFPVANHVRQAGAPAFVVCVDGLDRKEIRRLLQSGVRAILHRDPEITAALAAVAAGFAVVSPEVLDALLPPPSQVDDINDLSEAEPLTPRETEILALLAEGAANKEIASRLAISEHTVKFHVGSILAKLGAATRTEAVARGYREGLILM